MSMWQWMGICPIGVRLFPIFVQDSWPCWFHVPNNPPVVNLVTVPFSIPKPVITMTLHLWEIQG